MSTKGGGRGVKEHASQVFRMGGGAYEEEKVTRTTERSCQGPWR